MATDLRGIRRFSAKIGQLRSVTLTKILQELLKVGQIYAKELYAQSTNPTNPDAERGDRPVEVHYEIDGDRGTIYANGNAVAYLEYGYGLEGQNTYDGNLPKEPITFDAAGLGIITVDGWTYYYPNPYTKHDGGWDYDNMFLTGEPAEAQMWKTAIFLRDNAEAIIKRVIQTDLRKVKA